MLERLLVDNVGFATALGVAVFAAGYYLPFYEAYLYHAGARQIVVYHGGYEMTPALKSMIDRRQLVDARALGAIAVVGAAILAAWQIAVRMYDRPDIFSFLMGGLLLLEAAVALQRLRNIVFFRFARRAEGIQGKLEYSRRLALTLSFVDLYGFVALYLFAFLVSASWFFLGGALTCFVASRRLRDWVITRA